MAGTEAKAFSGTDDKYVQINEEQEAKALQDWNKRWTEKTQGQAYALGSGAKTEHQRRA